VLVKQILATVAQVEAHQRHPIASAIRQRPGVTRVLRIAENAHPFAIAAAHHLAPTAHAIGHLGRPAAIRQAMEAHAQAPVAPGRPAADIAGIFRK